MLLHTLAPQKRATPVKMIATFHGTAYIEFVYKY